MGAITLAIGLLIIVFNARANSQISGVSAELPRESIAATFISSQADPLRQFRALRHLEATNRRFNKHGWMDVRTELSPKDHFSFEVLAEGGSSYIRKKVLLPILEGERRVDIVRRYGRVGGARVPLGVETIAQIRGAGRSEMTMTYQYEMVNGQVVDTSAGSDTQ